MSISIFFTRAFAIIWQLLYFEDIHMHVDRQFNPLIRQGPSGPAFRTRAAGALGTTGNNRSQHQVQQEGQ